MLLLHYFLSCSVSLSHCYVLASVVVVVIVVVIVIVIAVSVVFVVQEHPEYSSYSEAIYQQQRKR
jgi:hypothetical protein